MNKISSLLDSIADRLEAKGYIKEAYEIDKVADVLGQISNILGLTTVPNMMLRDAVKTHLITIENVVRDAHTSSGNAVAITKIISALKRCDQLIALSKATTPVVQNAPVVPGVPK
jgi:hypothetical protein